MKRKPEVKSRTLRPLDEDELRLVVGGNGHLSSGEPPKDPPKLPDGTGGG